MSFAELRRKITEVGALSDPKIVPAVLRRLESFRRYDQDIARCGSEETLKDFWRDVKRIEEENLERLEALLEERSMHRRIH